MGEQPVPSPSCTSRVRSRCSGGRVAVQCDQAVTCYKLQSNQARDFEVGFVKSALKARVQFEWTWRGLGIVEQGTPSILAGQTI